jgi:uncharacterized protein
MTESSELRIDVAELLRRPGSRRDAVLDAAIADLAVGLVRVPPDRTVHAELALEPLSDGVVVHGRASVAWTADCARCLEEIEGSTEVGVDELFERRPVEGETYALEGTEIDLEPMLRDVLAVEFPLAPAPPLDGGGRCVRCHRAPTELGYASERPGTDPRWDALRTLDL